MWPNSRAACLLVAGLMTACGAWVASTALSASDRRSALFSGRDVLEFELAAPFDDLFGASVRHPDVTVRGRVSYLDSGSHDRVTIDEIRVSVRGNTSREFTECAFPKLKLHFPKGGATDGSVFEGTHALKIGTHCDDRPDGQLTFEFGRWPNEKSPFREGLVYRLLEAADVPVARTRLARITYVFDGGDSAAASTSGRSIVRNALLLEDDDDVMARLGAVGELTVKGGEPPSHDKVADTFENAQRNFSPTDSARVAFAQAMIGNFDWALRFYAGDGYREDGRKGLWNVRALARADHTAFPVMQDFDLAGIVTGSHQWYGQVFPEQFGPARSKPAIEVLAQVQRTRSLFDRGVLDAQRTSFIGRKAQLFSAVGELPVDAGGRANAEAYLTAFFEAIGSDKAFYLPVVTRADVAALSGAGDGPLPACGPKDHVPIGTPVIAVERGGGLVRAQLLDVYWHWFQRCDLVRNGPLWIQADAIESAYPPR